MQVYNDELYHFGKLGMKWGHRKTQSNLTTPTTKKETSTIKLKFKKHKAAKITASAIATLGTRHVVNELLLTKLGTGDTPRFIVSNIIGGVVGNTVANKLQDNY